MPGACGRCEQDSSHGRGETLMNCTPLRLSPRATAGPNLIEMIQQVGRIRVGTHGSRPPELLLVVTAQRASRLTDRGNVALPTCPRLHRRGIITGWRANARSGETGGMKPSPDPNYRHRHAWVSTTDQDLALQCDALAAAACEPVFFVTGAPGEGPAQRPFTGAIFGCRRGRDPRLSPRPSSSER